MSSIAIGKSEGGKAVKLDIGRLIVGRLLATADSGGGKSWLLRKILEQVSQTTQTIVIDTEGEFSTLREKRDMVLAGPGGECPAEPRSAALLCRRLMELNLSAVIDITELTPREKQEFVKNFCMTLVDLPRTLWHRCFIAIDELHEFAPEGEGSVSEDAVARLSSKGRKRGYSLIGATQRLSKLSKNVAAGLKNQFYGTFSLDSDIKRAAGALGFEKSRWTEIRDLSSQKGHEGEFFAFGPAFNHRGVIKMRTGMVETTHPEPGVGRAITPPAPSAKIKGVLEEFKDIPQQAEAEIKDLAAAKAKIAELERAARSRAKETPAAIAPPGPASKELQQQIRKDAALIAALKKGLADAMKVIAEINSKGFDAAGVDPEQIEKAIKQATAQVVKLVEQNMVKRQQDYERFKAEARKALASLQKLIDTDVKVSVDVQHNAPFEIKPSRPAAIRIPVAADAGGRAGLSPTERDVLDAAASFPGGATRQRISIFSGRSIKSSSFNAAFSGGEAKTDTPSLVQRGLLEQVGEKYVPTEAGMAMAQPTEGSSLADWMQKLTPSEAKVLECIARANGRRLTREEVSERTGQSTASSSFNGAFPALRDLGLIEGTKDFAATEELMDLA